MVQHLFMSQFGREAYMNDYTSNGTALLAVVAGILLCFWGYRLLKLSLGLIGFVAGAYAGWEIGLVWLHGSNVWALLCALIAGLVGMALCVWLYFLGVFLVGAMAGAAIASGVFNGMQYQAQPVLMFILPIVFGVVALVAQKLMISLCTAFSGAYLITAAAWAFLATNQKGPRIWLDPLGNHPATGTLTYGALIFWVVLALVGTSFQLRRARTMKAPDPEPSRR